MQRALALFNEHGLEAVGVRDLARDLGLSPGNVSYYFPRKQDLVAELMSGLAQSNAATIAGLPDEPGVAALLTRYRRTFEAQYAYRCLARSVVHIVETYPDLAADYQAIDVERRRGLTHALTSMIGRDLRADTSQETVASVVSICTLTARFWVSEMRLSFNHVEPARVMDHYVALIAYSLWQPATAAARRALEPMRSGLLVGDAVGDVRTAPSAARPRPR